MLSASGRTRPRCIAWLGDACVPIDRSSIARANKSASSGDEGMLAEADKQGQRVATSCVYCARADQMRLG